MHPTILISSDRSDLLVNRAVSNREKQGSKNRGRVTLPRLPSAADAARETVTETDGFDAAGMCAISAIERFDQEPDKARAILQKRALPLSEHASRTASAILSGASGACRRPAIFAPTTR